MAATRKAAAASVEWQERGLVGDLKGAAVSWRFR